MNIDYKGALLVEIHFTSDIMEQEDICIPLIADYLDTQQGIIKDLYLLSLG